MRLRVGIARGAVGRGCTVERVNIPLERERERESYQTARFLDHFKGYCTCRQEVPWSAGR